MKKSVKISSAHVFPNYQKDESNDVRVTAKNLRDSLANYYADEGIEDLVRIDLPKGPKYLSVFSFNRDSSLSKQYQLGMEMLSQLRLGLAEEHFIKILEEKPRYAELYLGLAQVYLLFRSAAMSTSSAITRIISSGWMPTPGFPPSATWSRPLSG